MNYIHFITSAPIEYSLKGMSLYTSFDAVSRGRKNAPLTRDAGAFLQQKEFPFSLKNIQSVFVAPAGQTVATAKLFKKTKRLPRVKIRRTKLLENIRFPMQKLISEEKFLRIGTRDGLNKARTQFLELLCSNHLPEKIPQLEKRIQLLLKKINSEPGDTLCIAHSFFLKIVEVYLSNPKALRNPHLLKRGFAPSRRPYNYLCGFSISKCTS